MECRYCQAANADDDHRCRRCGRRLRMSPVYAGSSAAAPVLQYERRARCLQYKRAGFAARSREQRCGASRQDGSAPLARAQRAAPPDHLSTFALYLARTAAGGAIRNHRSGLWCSPPSASRNRRRSASAGEGDSRPARLSSSTVSSRNRRSSKPADGVIYCDAPVAIPAHRAMAAAMDASIIVMALAVFGIVFRLAGGAFVLNA